MTRAVGKALSHESSRGHVTGGAKYVDDLGPSLANLVHAWPVIAPHAHAKLLAIDSAAALRQPGVLTLLTAADVPGVNDTGPSRRDEPLFPQEVVFHGQAVAWVLAESEEQARCGAAQVSVTYEPLPAILSIEQAIAAQSFLTEPEFMRRGYPERALAAAPLRLQGELFMGGQEHFYLETQAALAWYDEGDSLFVQSSTQHPTETQEIVARVLGVPKSVVVVQCLRMGGAFGGKETQANAWAALAALGARKLKRPVRVRLTRAQDMTLTGKRHPFLARFDVGVSETGKLLGLDVQLWSDGGCSLDLSSPVLARAMFHVDNCYLLPNVKIVGRVCRTNMVSHTAFRGFGGPQGMLVIEEIVARVAGLLRLPPHVVRARNFYVPGDDTHYGQAVRDADRIARIWDELQASSRFEARSHEIALFNAANVEQKRGLAITPVKFGISFTASFYNQAGALVLIYKDGSVQVNHGGTEMGQGLHTKMLQIAADALGVALASVRIMPTRTDKVPNTSATAASSGSDLNGAAVRNACDTLRQRLAEVAARRFQTHPEDIAFADGRAFCLHDESLSLTFAELVSQAYLQRVPLSATGYYRTPNIHYDRQTGRGKPFHYYAYGAAVSEVEVDAFTGQYRLLRVDILHDVGDSLSPLIDRGQIEGGFMQGVGWLATEELVWNAASGALATAGASTYKLPSLGECPPIFEVALLTRAAEPGVVHGSKAVGEPPFMLAISVREALRAAIAAFGSGGIPELASPATPEAVFWAIERVQRQAQRSRPDRNAAE
jgi:xanthine dehydrogenase large subunit